MDKPEIAYAEILFFAEVAHCEIEDSLQELFDGPWETYKEKDYQLTFHQIGYDQYDESIEVYLRADAPFEEKKFEFLDLIAKYGFSHGWLNFDDGTEICFSKNGLGGRIKKEHPHWSKEMAEDKNVLDQLDQFKARPVLRRMLRNYTSRPTA